MRPIVSGKVHSLIEIQTQWTLEDLFNFCELLDAQEDLEQESYDKQNKK